MSVIRVKLKDAGKNTLHPETEWSLVQGKPSFIVGDSWSNTTDVFNRTIAWFIYAPLGNGESAWIPATVSYYPFLASIMYVRFYKSSDGQTFTQQELSFTVGGGHLPEGYKLGRIERSTALPTSGSTPL